MVDAMGVIPRAAQELFEKLDGPAKHNRNSSTGLRTPSRYSMGSASSLKGNADKSWQLKATYVEVRSSTPGLLVVLLFPDLYRSTMSNCATCYSPIQPPPMNVRPLPFAKIPKAVSS